LRQLLSRVFLSTTAVALLLLAIESAVAAPVLMISVDGMKPEYVFEADARGLQVPYLRSLLADGSLRSIPTCAPRFSRAASA